MAFGQKKEKPKAPTFYLKPNGEGSYAGQIGEDNAVFKTTQTGKVILEINGGAKNGGTDFWGKPKTNQYGDFILFVIEGHFWYGKTMTTKYGETFQLKQGGKAEDSEEWKAKQTATAAADSPAKAAFHAGLSGNVDNDEGGAGPAGLSAPAGASPGVAIKTGSVAAPRPPKPSNYKRAQN